MTFKQAVMKDAENQSSRMEGGSGSARRWTTQAHRKQPWKCPVGKHVQGHNGGLKGMRAEAVVEERKDGLGPEEHVHHIKEIELLFEPQIQFKSL